MIKNRLDENNIWFVIKPEFAANSGEIKLEALSFSLSEQNILTELLVKKYNFFDKNGMNTDAIKQYVAVERESQISRIKDSLSVVKVQQDAVDKMNIRVGANGVIVRNPNNEVIGKFIPGNTKAAVSDKNPVIIKDKAGNTIAFIISLGASKSVVATYDNNVFDVPTSLNITFELNTKYYEDIAKYLAVREYMKGQPNSILIKSPPPPPPPLTKEEVEADLKRRTEVEGTLTLNDGSIITGNFKFDYRQTPDGYVAPQGSIVDTDAGTIIFYWYQDAKGKNTRKKYSVKEASSFHINQPDETYDVVTYKDDILTNSLRTGSINIGSLMNAKSQKFMLRLLVTEKACLYIYEGDYFLLKPGSESAVSGKILTPNALATFAKDCPEVAQKAKDGQYKDEESYIQFVKDYTGCM